MTNSTMVTNISFPDDWEDLSLLDQPLDMDAFLQSDLFAARRSHYMKKSIGTMISGSISFIASMLLVVHILRSHECLSSTYHRLIFALSAADIISSFCIALSSTMAPKEMSYLVPFASGNIATCDAQGFLINFAIGISMSYNCCICFYYLAIITYNKKYDYIKKNLEPWFHGVSMSVPLVLSAIFLATDTYNGGTGGFCYSYSHDPPHCIGYEAGDTPEGFSIPCGRGGENYGLVKLRLITLFGTFVWILIIAPITILVTMAKMYRSVAKIEKRMQKYGVSALRFRTSLAVPTANTNSGADQQEAISFAGKLKKLSKYLCFRCPCACDAGCYDPERPSRTTKSNKMTSQKRAILQMAFGYTGAWLLTWSPYLVSVVLFVVSSSYQDTVSVFTVSTIPLQGFFNFLVFMAPKVRTTRTMAMRRGRSSENNNQNQQHLTWCQAFYKAYMSRQGLEDRNMRNNNRTERRSTIFRKINGTFRSSIIRMKSFTASAIKTPSPEVIDTN
jgi:uncharacterized membrane protein